MKKMDMWMQFVVVGLMVTSISFSAWNVTVEPQPGVYGVVAATLCAIAVCLEYLRVKISKYFKA